MHHAPYLDRPRHNASALQVGAAGCVGRVLLVLAAVELISTPLTQYVWTWDHFLHGGMDFESSFLFLVICLGLLLVLRHHCRQAEDLPLLKWLSSLPSFHSDTPAAKSENAALMPFHRESHVLSGLAKCNFPLQV